MAAAKVLTLKKISIVIDLCIPSDHVRPKPVLCKLGVLIGANYDTVLFSKDAIKTYALLNRVTRLSLHYSLN
jgi:hypothetical protein